MLRNVTLIRWRADAAESQIAAAVAALRSMPLHVDVIATWSVGTDVGETTGNHDVVIVGEFTDLAGYRRYRDDPHHRRVSAQVVLPLVETFSRVLYEE